MARLIQKRKTDLMAFGIFILLWLFLKIFQKIILFRLKKVAVKTKTDYDDFLIKVFEEIKPPFYFFVSIYIALFYLNFNNQASQIVNSLIAIGLVYEVIQIFSKVFNFYIDKKINNLNKEQKSNQSILRIASIIFKIVLWVIAVILVLSNLGINVTSLIAGLGVGGIAVALAVQSVLSDIFSSFSIYIDKPFEVGDMITIGTDSGVVEKIGLRSTRIRTLQGEQLVVSNKELTTVRIQNFKKLNKRRSVINLGIVYQTPFEKVKSIPQLLKEIVESEEGTEFVRCYFSEFGSSSLDFELVFYITSSEFNKFVEIKQKINYKILQKLNQEKIEFAYPTQTVFVEK